MESRESTSTARAPWNKGKIVGQKTPFKLKEIWAIRVRLQLASRCRELALFNLAIDSKLRACDLVKLKVRDVCHGQTVASRTIVMQQKTQRPVQFEITEPTREAVGAWIGQAALSPESSLFPSRIHSSTHLSTRQYARIVDSWVSQLGLDKASYGTHTLRRTKATLIYRRTKNQRAVQLLLGHTKLESTVRYLGIEVNDALEMGRADRGIARRGGVGRRQRALTGQDRTVDLRIGFPVTRHWKAHRALGFRVPMRDGEPETRRVCAGTVADVVEISRDCHMDEKKICFPLVAIWPVLP